MGVVARAVAHFDGSVYAGSGIWTDSVGSLTIPAADIAYGMTEKGMLSNNLATHRTASAALHAGERLTFIFRLNLDYAFSTTWEVVGKLASFSLQFSGTNVIYKRWSTTTSSSTHTMTPAGGWPTSGWAWVKVESTASATKLYISSDSADTLVDDITWTEIASTTAAGAPRDSSQKIGLCYDSNISANGIGGVGRIQIRNSVTNGVLLDWNPSDFDESDILGGTLSVGGFVDSGIQTTVAGGYNRAFFTHPGVTFDLSTAIAIDITSKVSSKAVSAAMICRLMDLGTSPINENRALLGFRDASTNTAIVGYNMSTGEIFLHDGSSQIGSAAVGAATQDGILDLVLVNNIVSGKLIVYRKGVEIINENSNLAGASVDELLLNDWGSLAESHCSINNILLWNEAVAESELGDLPSEIYAPPDDVWRDLVRPAGLHELNTNRSAAGLQHHELYADDQTRVF